MRGFLLKCLILACSVLFCSLDAHAETTLDASLNWRFDQVLNEVDRKDSLSEVGVHVGLSESFVSWMTFSMAVGGFFAWRLDAPWQYHNQMRLEKTRQVWGVGVHGEVTFHLPSELVGVTGGFSARSFFMPTRSGLFRCDAYLGLRFGVRTLGVMRTAAFGVKYHFPLIDDFETVFDLKIQNTNFSIFAVWQF